jgi:S-adenosylmethionine synthetase
MKQQYYAAEAVLPGHPDKLCDAVADTLVREVARREKRGLCGVEVALHLSAVFVTGRLACEGAEEIDIAEAARNVFEQAGYSAAWAPDPACLDVKTAVCAGPLNEGEAEFRGTADDQSIVTGYAIDSPETGYLPPEQWLALGAMRSLEALRASRPDLQLGPDGKLAVVYDAAGDRLSAFSASLQQAHSGDEIELARTVRSVLRDCLERLAARRTSFRPELPQLCRVNGAGNFVVGGPQGDNGLSGKKLVVDAYGPRVPIGGGALSGKDFFKADRAGAILARRLAKAAVMTGAAPECTATLSIFPGDERFRVVSLSPSETALDPHRWENLMDLSLEAAGELWSAAVDPVACARYGHFVDDCAWERLSF